MTILGRLLAAAIVFVVAARTTATAVHAAVDFPSRNAVYFTEPQMVHLSREVQLGRSVCPEWREFPHVVNVFTPGYFLLVGGVGKATAASLDGLQRIGRGATILFATLGAALMACAVRRRGRVAMLAAGGTTIASGMMVGFGWMCRPDVAADALGFAGFLAAASAAPTWIPIAALGAAMFCKQTAVVYLAAAALALGWRARWRRGAIVVVGSVAMIGLALATLWLSGERRAFADVFLESSSPWRWDHWKTVNLKFLSGVGDAGLIACMGAATWLVILFRGSEEDRTDSIRWLSLFVAATAIGVVGSAKLGSDVNYYLPLRFAAAAAVATVVAGLLRAEVRFHWLLAGALALAATAFWSLPTVAWMSRQFGSTATDERRLLWEREIDNVELMSRSKRVLTNCDDAALRIGNPFVDGFVFKMMVDDGRLKPTLLKERVARGEYDWIVATAELDDPNYIASSHGFPKELADVVLRRYEKAFRQGLIYYRPRKE